MKSRQHHIKGVFVHLLWIIFSFYNKSIAQVQNDTLDRLDAKHKKTGYWKLYLDSNFNTCQNNRANYYAYFYFNKGKPRSFSFGRFNKKDSLFYLPFSEMLETKPPVLLNGNLMHYEYYKGNKLLRLQETYKNGILKSVVENINWRSSICPDIYFFYFDSLYERRTDTYLYYMMEKNVMLYKRYVRYPHKPVSEKIYLVPHRDFKSINRPILGYHVFWDATDSVQRSFVELGFSKKFISGSTIDTINVTHKDNRLVYHSFNFSLMASNSHKQFYLGQRMTYAYNLLFLRTELGLANYTDFRSTDLSAVFGIGVTIIGYFNEMFYFSIPILSNKSNSYPRLSFSIVID